MRGRAVWQVGSGLHHRVRDIRCCDASRRVDWWSGQYAKRRLSALKQHNVISRACCDRGVLQAICAYAVSSGEGRGGSVRDVQHDAHEAAVGLETVGTPPTHVRSLSDGGEAAAAAGSAHLAVPDERK